MRNEGEGGMVVCCKRMKRIVQMMCILAFGMGLYVIEERREKEGCME